MDDDEWRKGSTLDLPSGDDPDGSFALLSLLDGNPETYQRWAEDYFEVAVSRAAVDHIYRHYPLTAEIVGRLNGEAILEDLASDVREIGYPT